MSLPGGTDANESRYDAEMIAHIRSARAQAADDQWSIRLTLGEVDALLRAVDDRDDLKRRLVGEWEGDVPEPMPAVEVVPHEGTLGDGITWPLSIVYGTCRYCGEQIAHETGTLSWMHRDDSAGQHPATPTDPA